MTAVAKNRAAEDYSIEAADTQACVRDIALQSKPRRMRGHVDGRTRCSQDHRRRSTETARTRAERLVE